ncbi:tyrosine-type recombinase/integrase [Phreatobacter sp.]|uniref:tyrosine-type recombinase/integrase n=1 Tax=Phreatobacter sp. TaxID=1966341 RepID=UPI003F6E50A2
MGRGNLTALKIAALSTPGRYGDGGGLYLQVAKGGTKAWLFRFMLDGRARQMGLGPVELVSLAQAREKAIQARQLLLDGIDPIDARDAAREARRAEKASAITFKEAGARYVATHRAGWKNAVHVRQWEQTLETYCDPILGSVSVAEVNVGMVLKVLEPIWLDKHETASRLRGRLEAILDWSTARGYRKGDNPARWRGHLENLLPRISRAKRIKGHAALPYEEAPAFMHALRARNDVSSRALEFLILTAARTGEVIGARWSEVNVAEKVWTVPAERIKAGREHRVPLSDRALEILRTVPTEGDFIFPGRAKGAGLSNMALLGTLKRMGREDLTAHGFRSTFRTWAGERTNFAREVAEQSLAHVVGDAVERAYARGDLFEKRRRLMSAWAGYLATEVTAGEVVAIHGGLGR